MARRQSPPTNPKLFEPEETSPLELYTPAHGNLLAMMAEGGKSFGEEEEPPMHTDAITDDHAVAATLPVDRSVVEETGHMDHHRKPIISIHGKDVDEHELNHENAA